jgi:hypothetical protein
MFKNFIITIVLLFSFTLYSQNEIKNLSNPNLIKHQIGIGISKFINSAFSSDINAFNIEYRYKYSNKTSLRSGLSYEKDGSENGFINGGVKFGIDRLLRKYEKWTYYYGLDLIGNYSNYKNINKDIYSFGTTQFIGIQYNASQNFSISIEPMLYIKNNIVIDNSTFDINKKKEWVETGLGKLGYIQLNFHF